MTRIALCQIPVSPDPVGQPDKGPRSSGQSRGRATWRSSPRRRSPATAGASPSWPSRSTGRSSPGVSEAATGARPRGDRRECSSRATAGCTTPPSPSTRDGAIKARLPEDPPVRLLRREGVRAGRARAPSPVVVELAGIRVGLVTCYDVRFPELTRALVDRGAEMFAVIAAWGSGPLKEDHWVTLVTCPRDGEHDVDRRRRPGAQPGRGHATATGSAAACWSTRWAWSAPTSAPAPGVQVVELDHGGDRHDQSDPAVPGTSASSASRRS